MTDMLLPSFEEKIYKGDIKSLTQWKKLSKYYNTVQGSVDFTNKKIHSLTSFVMPIKIYGDLHLTLNKGIRNLLGCTKYVLGNFSANRCSLESLEGGPIYVGKNYNVSENKFLKTIKGIPKTILGDVSLFGTKYLNSFEGYISEVKGSLYASSCGLTNLFGFPKKIHGNCLLSNNKFSSLDGIQQTEIGGFLHIATNKIPLFNIFPLFIGTSLEASDCGIEKVVFNSHLRFGIKDFQIIFSSNYIKSFNFEQNGFISTPNGSGNPEKYIQEGNIHFDNIFYTLINNVEYKNKFNNKITRKVDKNQSYGIRLYYKDETFNKMIKKIKNIDIYIGKIILMNNSDESFFVRIKENIIFPRIIKGCLIIGDDKKNTTFSLSFSDFPLQVSDILNIMNVQILPTTSLQGFPLFIGTLIISNEQLRDGYITNYISKNNIKVGKILNFEKK